MCTVRSTTTFQLKRSWPINCLFFLYYYHSQLSSFLQCVMWTRYSLVSILFRYMKTSLLFFVKSMLYDDSLIHDLKHKVWRWRWVKKINTLFSTRYWNVVYVTYITYILARKRRIMQKLFIIFFFLTFIIISLKEIKSFNENMLNHSTCCTHF